jgi:hypothetical protein
MRLQRPIFRFWPILAAIVSSYPIAGFLYGLDRFLLPDVTALPGAGGLRLIADLLYASFMGAVTLPAFGFPIVEAGIDERANLYPVIVPVAVVLIVLACRARAAGRPAGPADRAPWTLALAALRGLGIGTVALAAVLDLTYLALAFAGMAPTPYDCITGIRRTIADPSGLDFEISETNCDSIAKQDAMVVSVTKRGSGKKAALFVFDPIYWIALPSVSVDAARTIVISVPRVGSVLSQARDWNGMPVRYDIGRIDSAAPGARAAGP